MVSNKKLGSDFEQEFCKILSGKGYWVHNFANRKNGQPADVIAVKNGTALLLDCKVCSNGVFDTRRIELNQHLAMRKWERCGNGTAWFAIKMDDDIYVVHYNALDRQGKAISKRFIQMIGIKLEQFLEEQDENNNKQ